MSLFKKILISVSILFLGYVFWINFYFEPEPGVVIDLFDSPKFVSSDTVGKEEKGTEIEVKNGESFYMNLAANPSTGYDWTVNVDDSFVEYLGHESTGGGWGVGSQSSYAYNFKALKTGETDINLIYERSKERGFAISEVLKTIRVRVKII